ncbi:MAG: hypothetical protein JWM62_795 [Frankiales bacterium]|jgi:hypothetical protein|nr:hypothetical protein [Frankiales bacterium]
MRRPDRGEDSGTILLLVLGFTAVLLLMVAVVVNVSSVILAKRGVVSAADGAAVAAAQELDLSVLYARGLGVRIPLDPGKVGPRVEQYEVQARQSQPGLDLDGQVSADGTTAIVRGVRMVDLPFGEILGFQPVRVEAEARAQAPTSP